MSRAMRVSISLVYGAILVVGLTYHDELRWAVREFPRYARGSIGVPEERALIRRAHRLIRSGDHGDDVRALLERSLAIDPVGDAVYLMGELWRARGDDAAALPWYLRSIEIDPTLVGAYLHGAAIYRRSDRDDDARELLRRGVRYFSSHRERYWPSHDDEVDPRFNEKATAVYRAYAAAESDLREALAELD